MRSSVLNSANMGRDADTRMTRSVNTKPGSCISRNPQSSIQHSHSSITRHRSSVPGLPSPVSGPGTCTPFAWFPAIGLQHTPCHIPLSGEMILPGNRGTYRLRPPHSPIIHPPSSILHPPSSILHPPSSIIHPPSTILPFIHTAYCL